MASMVVPGCSWISERPARHAVGTEWLGSCASTSYAASRATRCPERSEGGHQLWWPPNRLERQFTVDAPDKAWVTDMTYVRTRQGWLYLAIVMDLYCRRVVGWSMKPSLARELVLDAIIMAVSRLRPAKGLVIHSEQGSQYSSDDFQGFYRAHHPKPSMSRRGNCWDNALAESFFSSLKKERIRKRIYRTRNEAKAHLFDYTEMFYNHTRGHGHLDSVSPRPSSRPHKAAPSCPRNRGNSNR